MTELAIGSLVESMSCFVGRTVSIFTTSGGISGSGFTGVLVSVDCNFVRLLVEMSAPPSCPLGSSCTGPVGNCSGCGGWSNGCASNPLGAICVIPTCAIACFTHNAI